MNSNAPLALLGYAPDAARAFRELGLLALTLPAEPLPDVLSAMRTLQFIGVLLGPALEEHAFAHVNADSAARKAHRVDAVAFTGNAIGTHTLEEALLQLVQNSTYAARGARMLILGSGTELKAATGLVRLGAASVTVAAPSKPEAEHVLTLVPAGVKGYALAQNDSALAALAERADLVIVAYTPAALTAGTVNQLLSGLLQPFHTLLDFTGRTDALAEKMGVTRFDASELASLRLSLQVEHATGQRFKPDVLRSVAAGLH